MHPRGKTTPKSTPGSFAEKGHTAPELALAPAETPAELREALEFWGLDASDVPGLTEAWRERFAPLDTPEEATAEQLAAAIFGIHATHDRVESVTVHREGDTVIASVEVYDEARDEYHDYRYVATGEDRDHLLLALERKETQRHRSMLASERKEFSEGRRPVWHLLADPDELAAAGRLVSERSRDVRMHGPAAERAKAFEAAERLLAEALAAGDNSTVRGLHDRPLGPQGEDSFETRLSSVRLPDAFRVLHHRTVAQARLKALTEAEAEAKALPDGPLKELLLAERPEQSYPTVEGKGRSKRILTRTYRPKSELMEALDKATREADGATSAAESLESRMAEWRAEHAEVRAEAKVLENAQAEAAAALHALGWPGPGPVPQRAPASS